MNKNNLLLLVTLLLLVIASILLRYYWVTLEWKDIIMTDAVIIGPVVAVVITRMLDNEKFEKERKLSIFRALVKDRSNPLSYDFVNAFNLIQIEFSNDTEVIKAWKSLSESRNAAGPAKDDSDGWSRKYAEWNGKTNQLLFEIAKALDIKVSPFDIQTSYFPRAWSDDQQINSEIRALLHQLLDNKRSISVKINEPEPLSEANKKKH